VLIGIFSVGLALDELFDRYGKASTTPLSEIQSFGQSMADFLNAAQSVDEITTKWPETSEYRITIEQKTELALPEFLYQQLISNQMLTLESEQGVSLHFYLSQHDEVLSIQTALEQNESDSGLSWILTILFYVATLLLVLLWLRPLLHRLRVLRRCTRAFGQGNLDSRIDVRGVTYIKDIEQDFNSMADRIQQLVDDNKLLTSAVSHDLRTPLARLRFGVDTLSDTSNPKSIAVYLKRINNDLNEMESLVESLLRYARLDNVIEGVEKQAIDVHSLLEECIAQHYDSDIKIQLIKKPSADESNLMVYGGIEHIATLLNNLISNALTYANGLLLIDIGREGEQIKVNFSDDGPGIPADLRGRVVKPFERGAVSAEAKAGFGLGLAVAARIAERHHGSLVIGQSSQLGGALISVTLAHYSGNSATECVVN